MQRTAFERLRAPSGTPRRPARPPLGIAAAATAEWVHEPGLPDRSAPRHVRRQDDSRRRRPALRDLQHHGPGARRAVTTSAACPTPSRCSSRTSCATRTAPTSRPTTSWPWPPGAPTPRATVRAPATPPTRSRFTPERVLMQDFTGVPGVVDLAAMRDALARLGGDASQVNPLVPVELVIDHSVIVERSGDPSAYDTNVSIEYARNMERYQLLRWAQGAFRGLPARAARHGHLPPGQPRVPVPPRLRHRGRACLLRHPRRHRLAHDHGQRARRARAGASAASRPRRPCWASRSPCCCPRSSGSASPASPSPASPRPTSC